MLAKALKSTGELQQRERERERGREGGGGGGEREKKEFSKPQLPVEQIFGRCISSRFDEKTPEIPGIARRIHKPTAKWKETIEEL